MKSQSSFGTSTFSDYKARFAVETTCNRLFSDVNHLLSESTSVLGRQGTEILRMHIIMLTVFQFDTVSTTNKFLKLLNKRQSIMSDDTARLQGETDDRPPGGADPWGYPQPLEGSSNQRGSFSNLSPLFRTMTREDMLSPGQHTGFNAMTAAQQQRVLSVNTSRL